MSNTEIGAMKNLLQETAKSLKGHARRLFMARTVEDVFEGVTYRAEQEMGRNRATISKGLHELSSGVECVDGRKGLTGQKPAEAHLPNLRNDIRDLVDSQRQTDARFRTHRLCARMSAAEVRRQLHEKKGYPKEIIPRAETIRCKLTPYHTKYNPAERCWGVLERHWNGDLLDAVDTVVGYAQSLTWKHQHPVVRLVTQTYESGVRLSKKAMKPVENRLSRLPHLSSWFIDICCQGAI